jgi:peptidoglycan L-alanyl-D-glutamate endopeptidase CwlK
MPFQLGARSLSRLEGVNPRMVAVVKLAISISPVDFVVVEGVRTPERQRELYAQGRTKPGKVVTWTLKSKHIDGLAVDLAPWVNGAVDWNDLAKFDAIAKAMMTAAKQLNTPIRWGANWDGDERPREKGEGDSPHFELAQ